MCGEQFPRHRYPAQKPYFSKAFLKHDSEIHWALRSFRIQLKYIGFARSSFENYIGINLVMQGLPSELYWNQFGTARNSFRIPHGIPLEFYWNQFGLARSSIRILLKAHLFCKDSFQNSM